MTLLHVMPLINAAAAVWMLSGKRSGVFTFLAGLNAAVAVVGVMAWFHQ